MNSYFLSAGDHPPESGERCAMEWVAFLAGEEHSDRPVCVDPVLRVFCISLNDALEDDERQKLRPYLARCIGTATDGRSVERGFMCLDWLIRTQVPALLDLAGPTIVAEQLRDLPPITHRGAIPAARQLLYAQFRAFDAREWNATEAARSAAVRAGDCAVDFAHVGVRVGVVICHPAGLAGRAVREQPSLLASVFELLDRMLPTVMIDLPQPTMMRVEAMA